MSQVQEQEKVMACLGIYKAIETIIHVFFLYFFLTLNVTETTQTLHK